MTEPDVKMECTCPACPVQYEGMINGVPFYFRARGDSWEIGIGEDPVGVSQGDKDGWRQTESYGDDPYIAGWMPHKEAEELIKECAQDYVKYVDAPVVAELKMKNGSTITFKDYRDQGKKWEGF